jgi:hypothetical protein
MHKNVLIYLGDFLVFLGGWIVLFGLAPQAAWVQVNHARFWPVTFILLGLIGVFWFRASRAVAAIPELQVLYLLAMIRTDPDMASVLL